MEKWIKHIASIMTIGFFGFLALACEDGTDDQWIDLVENCADPVLVLKEPLNTPVLSEKNYKVRLLDAETSNPVSGIQVNVVWHWSFCNGISACPFLCAMTPFDTRVVNYYTDLDGEIEGQTYARPFEDEKDRILVCLVTTDNEGIYLRRNICLHYNYASTTKSITLYLYKYSAL